MHRRKTKDGKTLAGPRYPVPLVGGLVQMVMDPFGFWERQRKCASVIIVVSAVVSEGFLVYWFW